MTTTVLILASGLQTRFSGNVTKQLLKVDGVTLIDRMIEQSQRIIGVTPIVISCNTDILDHMFPSENVVMPVEDEFVCDTVFSTRDYWTDKTIFLLGDVYYTDEAINIINIVPRVVFGDEVEIYGIRLLESDWLEAELSLMEALDEAGRGNTPGKLWHFYRAFEGYDQHDHRLGGQFCLIEDSTQDFDTMEEYDLFMEKRS